MSNVAKLKAALGTKDEAALFAPNTFTGKDGTVLPIVNPRGARRGVSPAVILLIAENIDAAVDAAIAATDAAETANAKPAEPVESGAKQSVAELKRKLAKQG